MSSDITIPQIEKQAKTLQESLQGQRARLQELQQAQAQTLAEIHGHEGALLILQRLVSDARAAVPAPIIEAEVV